MRLRSFVTISVIALCALLAPFAAPAQAQAGDAKIRLAHFSPDANGVDVYIDGKKRMNRVPYQAVSDYITVPAGKHTIEIRGEGQAESTPALISAAPVLAGGGSFTAATLGPVANIEMKVFADILTAPAPGKAKVRVIHAADGTPTVDIGIKDGDVLFPGVAFGAITTYLEVTAGPYVLQVRKAGDSAVVIEKPVTVQPGGIYTIAAVGGADKPATLRGFVDLAAKPGGSGATATTGTTALGESPGDTTNPSATKVIPKPTATKPAPTTTEAAVAVPRETEPEQVEPDPTVPPKPDPTVPPTKAPVTPTTVPAAVGGGSTNGGEEDGSQAVVDPKKGGASTGGATENNEGSAGSGTDAGDSGDNSNADGSGAAPIGGAKTGFGGMSDTSSALSVLAMGAAFLAMLFAGVRRRNAQG